MKSFSLLLVILLLAQTPAPRVQPTAGPVHRLDPLSAAEITLVTDALSKAGRMPASVRVVTIELSEPDKASTGLGASEDAWPTPYWTVDASMSVMTMLLAAEDAGLGALFFGVFKGERELRRALGIPAVMQLLGAVAIGWPAEATPPGGAPVVPAGATADVTSLGGPGRSAGKPRRRPEEIIHRGGWRVG